MGTTKQSPIIKVSVQRTAKSMSKGTGSRKLWDGILKMGMVGSLRSSGPMAPMVVRAAKMLYPGATLDDNCFTRGSSGIS